MTAGCITFEEIESRTESTVALAIHARHVQQRIFAYTIGLALVRILAGRLDDVKSSMNTSFLDKCSNEQLHELANLLAVLTTRINRVLANAKDSGLYDFGALKTSLARIENRCEDIESIVENIHLAVNPNFHKVVSSALSQLEVGVEDSALLHQ